MTLSSPSSRLQTARWCDDTLDAGLLATWQYKRQDEPCEYRCVRLYQYAGWNAGVCGVLSLINRDVICDECRIFERTDCQSGRLRPSERANLSVSAWRSTISALVSLLIPCFQGFDASWSFLQQKQGEVVVRKMCRQSPRSR